MGWKNRAQWGRRAAVLGAASLCFVHVHTVRAAESCPVSYGDLTAALKQSVKPSGGPSNGGLDNPEWAAVVDRHGAVCAVTFSGATADAQWPGSRAIAVEKANTANALSLRTFALSTANLYSAAQPGGFLYGLSESNPPNPAVIYAGPAASFGTEHDPMIGKTPGGVVVFGGGLALYDGNDIVGGLGVSGDTSCADHNVAWRVRRHLKLDKVPAGPNTGKDDGIVYDIGPNGKSAAGYGHPSCIGNEVAVAHQIGAGSGAGGK